MWITTEAGEDSGGKGKHLSGVFCLFIGGKKRKLLPLHSINSRFIKG